MEKQWTVPSQSNSSLLYLLPLHITSHFLSQSSWIIAYPSYILAILFIFTLMHSCHSKLSFTFGFPDEFTLCICMCSPLLSRSLIQKFTPSRRFFRLSITVHTYLSTLMVKVQQLSWIYTCMGVHNFSPYHWVCIWPRRLLMVQIWPARSSKSAQEVQVSLTHV